MRLTCEKLGTPQRSSPRHGPVRGRDGRVMFSWCIHFTTAIAEPLRRKLLNTRAIASTMERSGSNTTSLLSL